MQLFCNNHREEIKNNGEKEYMKESNLFTEKAFQLKQSKADIS